jgi:hypothetical protein
MKKWTLKTIHSMKLTTKRKPYEHLVKRTQSEIHVQKNPSTSNTHSSSILQLDALFKYSPESLGSSLQLRFLQFPKFSFWRWSKLWITQVTSFCPEQKFQPHPYLRVPDIGNTSACSHDTILGMVHYYKTSLYQWSVILYSNKTLAYRYCPIATVVSQ